MCRTNFYGLNHIFKIFKLLYVTYSIVHDYVLDITHTKYRMTFSSNRSVVYPIVYVGETPPPSEIPSDSSSRCIRSIYSINHPGKIVTRSRNSVTCVPHHNSHTVTPWFCLKKSGGNSFFSISHSIFDCGTR